MRPALPLLTAAALLAVAGALPAQAATNQVTWGMNESAGAMVMHAAGGVGPNGNIGTHVVTGQPTPTSKGYLFPSPTPGTADPQRLVTVPDSAATSPFLDPGSSPITFTVVLKPASASGQYNVLQKGQAGAGNSYYKLEINSAGTTPGQPACAFTDGTTLGKATWRTPISTTAFHSIVCTKTATAVSISVDGQSTSTAVAVGNISNADNLSIGGKSKCNPPTVDCDYFAGVIDKTSISIG